MSASEMMMLEEELAELRAEVERLRAEALEREERTARIMLEVERLREMLLNAGWPREAEELAAEALRYERAAVVAYLREEGSINSMLSVLKGAADEIERGEHRRGEGT